MALLSCTSASCWKLRRAQRVARTPDFLRPVSQHLALRPRCPPKAKASRHNPVCGLENASCTNTGHRLNRAIAATFAAWLMSQSAQAASDSLIQTVPASAVTDYAKPFKKQPVDKFRIWVVLIGGAAVLFIGTVASENNSGWFPAISKANKALAMARQASQTPAAPPVVDVPAAESSVRSDPPRLAGVSPSAAEVLEGMDTSVVEAGLAAARKRVLEEAMASGGPSEGQVPPVLNRPDMEKPPGTDTAPQETSDGDYAVVSTPPPPPVSDWQAGAGGTSGGGAGGSAVADLQERLQALDPAREALADRRQ